MAEELRMVVVSALLTVWDIAAEVLVLKLVSPRYWAVMLSEVPTARLE